MKIAVVGKWGSGKSTVSTLLALHFAQQWKKVLAIDADYNMDMAYTLLQGDFSLTVYMNTQKKEFFQELGVESWSSWNVIVEKFSQKRYTFSLSDSFTKSIIQLSSIDPLISVITVGWLNDEIIFWESCSHSYFKPLKHYLWALDVDQESIVIIDSVAGTDMVGYGLYVGVDLLINVVEPTIPSINVSKQIQAIAEKLHIPFHTIGNKRKKPDQQEYVTLWHIYEDIGLVSTEKNPSQENVEQIGKIANDILNQKIHSSQEIIERYHHYYTFKK